MSVCVCVCISVLTAERLQSNGMASSLSADTGLDGVTANDDDSSDNLEPMRTRSKRRKRTWLSSHTSHTCHGDCETAAMDWHTCILYSSSSHALQLSDGVIVRMLYWHWRFSFLTMCQQNSLPYRTTRLETLLQLGNCKDFRDQLIIVTKIGEKSRIFVCQNLDL